MDDSDEDDENHEIPTKITKPFNDLSLKKEKKKEGKFQELKEELQRKRSTAAKKKEEMAKNDHEASLVKCKPTIPQWKLFLTQEPIEPEPPEDSRHQRDFKEEEDVESEDEKLVKMEFQKPKLMPPDIFKHINPSVYRALLGVKEQPKIMDKNFTYCEYCEVKVKVRNLSRHWRKCSAKLGYKVKKK